MSASRYDHVHSVVRPALSAGAWIVTDRFIDSTFAYQAYGDDRLMALFRDVTSAVIGEYYPDYTFILDVGVDEAEARRKNRSVISTDPSEANRDFQALRTGFLVAARQAPNRCYVIEAAGDEDHVFAEIWKLLNVEL